MNRPPDLPAPCRLIAHDSLASTNEEACRLATEGADAWTVVSARQQTAGRGRRGNNWLSPPGNMYVSLVLRPDCDVAMAAQLGFVTALALSDAIFRTTGLQATLKWPNDLLLGRRKVSGILVESAGTHGGGVDWVVVGTGVNVASHPETLPDTTDLAAEGANVALNTMIEAYVDSMQHRFAQWQSDGFAVVRRDWLASASGIGDPIRVRLADREEHGVFEDLDESGALVLVQGARRQLITSGDIFLAGVT